MPRTNDALVTALLFCAAVVALAVAPPRSADADFEQDEAEWLTISTAHFQQLAGRGDPWHGIASAPPQADGNPWKSGIHASTFGFMNPGLAKTVIGTVLAASGHDAWDPNVYRRFTRVKEHKRAAQEVVRPALAAGRRVSLVLAAFAGVLLFWTVARAGGRVAGSTAYVLWVASPLVREHAHLVLTDLFPVVFALAAACVAARPRPGLAWPALLGLWAGCAVASKLNGALVALAAAVWIALAWWRAGRPTSFARGPLAGWIVAGSVTVAVFVAACPALWIAPWRWPGELAEVLSLWAGDTELRQAEARGVGVAHTLGERLALAVGGTLGRHETIVAWTGLPAGWVLVPAGLVALVLRLRRGSVRHADGAAALLVLALVVGAGTAGWLPLDWERYYLPLVAVVSSLEAALLGSSSSSSSSSPAPASRSSISIESS